mmetsp:Transcript_31416/g.73351  ORF Transcript_31416/g.73351 Transcript_31416/m.73351 type:complete len:545 (+) Transcript_31416:74-1708(+)
MVPGYDRTISLRQTLRLLLVCVCLCAEVGAQDEFSCPLAVDLLSRLSASLKGKIEERSHWHCMGDNTTELSEDGKFECLLEALSPAKASSKTWRAGELGSSETYGELNTSGAFKLLSTVSQFGVPFGPEDKFADLGSGRSHAVLQFYLCTMAKEALGIEIVQERHEVAEYMQKKLAKELKSSPDLASKVQGRELTVIGGSLTDKAELWSDSTLVLANNLMWDDVLMHQFRGYVIKNLKPGTIILTSAPMAGCRNDVIRRFGSIAASVRTTKDFRLHIYMRWPQEKVLDGLSEPVSEDACLAYFKSLPSHLGKRLCTSIIQVETETTGVHKEIEELHGMDGRCAWSEWQWLRKMPEATREAIEGGGLSAFMKDVAWTAAKDKDSGRTLIHHAAMSDDTTHIAELVKLGADINALSDIMQTPLHIANSAAMVKAVVAAGGNIEALDKFKRHPLHVALEKSSVEVIEALLAAGADIKTVDGTGHNTLHIVARRKGSEAIPIVHRLLKGGVDVLHKDIFGRTAEADCKNPEVKKIIHEAVKRARSEEL